MINERAGAQEVSVSEPELICFVVSGWQLCNLEDYVMSDSGLIRRYPDFFVSEIHQEVLWLKFSGNFFHNVTSFDKRDFLGDYFRRLKKNEDLKTVVFETNYRESGVDEYVDFFLSHTDEASLFGGSRLLEINKLSNIINQTIINMIELNKFTIQICQGATLSIFMNIGFACDYRIVSENTVFYNAFKKIGGLPLGGGSFFLTKLLGRSRANQLLLLEDEIPAGQALELGIVDKVVAQAALESTVLRATQKISQVQPRTLSGIKRLTNYSLQELKVYLARETEELQRVCVQMGQQKVYA